MTDVTNPKTATWTNPTTATTPEGAQVAFDPATEEAGIQLEIDGKPVVAAPSQGPITTIDLTTIDAYKALPAGSHTLQVAAVTKDGEVGDYSAAVTFLRTGPHPDAPTSLALA